MTNTALVFSREGCQPCRLTKQACEAAGYRVIECRVDLEDKGKNWELEYHTRFPNDRQLPGVCIHDADDNPIAEWTGFRPDLIKKHTG